MWQIVCECMSKLTTPNLQNLLNSLRENNICTNTQCFSTMQDAGFGFINSTPPPNMSFFFLMFCMFVVLFMNRPSNILTHKTSETR